VRSERIHRRLIQQVWLLHCACLDYDSGNSAEALNVALRLKILFHDARDSVSLAQLADIKRTLKMCDSGTYQRAPGLAHSALTWGYRNTHLPCFDDFVDGGMRIFLPFERWWCRKVASDCEGQKYSRKRLVLALAHRDRQTDVGPRGGFGGDHGDLEHKHPMQTAFAHGNGLSQSVDSPVPAAMRQMGYEALVSLAEFHPEAFDDDDLAVHYRKPRSTRDVLGITGVLFAANPGKT
jgi:hypothetical protein